MLATNSFSTPAGGVEADLVWLDAATPAALDAAKVAGKIVAADGRVVIRTAEMDVEAGEFELDVPSQIGVATADEGRMVTVIRRGTATPARAHAFRWDLVKGSLSVEGARGVFGR